MTEPSSVLPMSRRDLLAMIGLVAGSGASYRAMASMGLVAESTYKGPIKLDGGAKGKSVLILGAGHAGSVAAYELRKAGYKVQILEYNERVGGRCWTLRGGDKFTELGGATQTCGFDPGLYVNPGPWRIPFHHRALLDYCKRFGVALEPFVQVNYNAYLHSTEAFGGKPQRYRNIHADFNGHVAELLAKCTSQNKLDDAVSKEDTEILLSALKEWGALDKNYSYASNPQSSERRGWEKPPGGGIGGAPIPSTPMSTSDVLKSGLWHHLSIGQQVEFQTTLFQPVGGMDGVAKAFQREIGDLVRYRSKVTKIDQNDSKVTVTYVDSQTGGAPMQATADYCLCTIPLSVLSQIDIKVGPKMARAIRAVPYESAVKLGLQFKRRFWEEDEHIYGGTSYTDMPIRLIGYPNTGYHSSGKGVLLGGYMFGPNAYEFTALPPAERVRKAVEYGSKIHAQYKTEFDNGIAVGWHRVPWTLGCAGTWTEDTRAAHYDNLCQLDGRIMLAGEHASYVNAWQEGALLSSLNAIERLHKHVQSH
ncbi:MAG: flavin monoamine oxidase [Hydrocarboniphaga sp.]|uniref:flavin monoamine oxidase family protein n=1 Tax=Hydrocarboniphaga sp. TaxID=2033016 RepID=UPI0026069A2B|nr:flavin monoamine oxidase family protein [Hydrocarboniphaga sp.]MDB5972108.1 flavin monoamine oxidase [Hydrocarboniphaga sp.]